MRKTRERHDKAPEDAASQRCRMCGTNVAVGPDGRCRLGHHIGLPLQPQRVVADPVDTTHDDAADTEPVEAVDPVAVPVAFDHAPGPFDVPASDPYAHPYDDVLSWDAPPAPTPEPAPTQAGSELRSAIDELLAWDQPPPASALDVHVDELPLPPAPPPLPAPPPRTEFVDEEAEVAEEEASRRRLATLLGGGAVAMVAGFVAAVAGLPL